MTSHIRKLYITQVHAYIGTIFLHRSTILLILILKYFIIKNSINLNYTFQNNS
jgi:hypothetical protein